MAKITWNASGGTGAFSPSDAPLSSDQSDAIDGRFGGRRETSNTAKDQDYTSRTGGASNVKENPVNEVTKDVDDLTDPNQRKREFSYQEEKSNVQKSNEASFIIKTDTDHMPSEDTDAFVPDDQRHRSKLKAHFGEGQYDNMPNRGSNYEGEVR